MALNLLGHDPFGACTSETYIMTPDSSKIRVLKSNETIEWLGISIACGAEVKGCSSRKAERHGPRACPGSAAEVAGCLDALAARSAYGSLALSSGCQALVHSVSAAAQVALLSAVTAMPLSGLLLF